MVKLCVHEPHLSPRVYPPRRMAEYNRALKQARGLLTIWLILKFHVEAAPTGKRGVSRATGRGCPIQVLPDVKKYYLELPLAADHRICG